MPVFVVEVATSYSRILRGTLRWIYGQATATASVSPATRYVLHRSWIRALFIRGLDMAALLELALALRRLNETAHFNKWCVLEVAAAGPCSVVIAMPWLSEVAQTLAFRRPAGLERSSTQPAVSPNVNGRYFKVLTIKPVLNPLSGNLR